MSLLSAAANDEDGDTIRQLRSAIEQARDWIAEHPDRRPISAGRMVAILTNALAARPDYSPDAGNMVPPVMTPIGQRKLDFLLGEGWAISGYSICKTDPAGSLRHGFVTDAGLVGWWAQPHPMHHSAQHLDMVPVGWQLVPVEPNMTMTQAALNASRRWAECDAPLPRGQELWAAGVCWNAMLAAAPQPPVVEQPQGEQEPVAWAEEIIEYLHAHYDTEMIKELDSGDALIRLDDAIAAVEEVAQRYTHPQPPRQPLTEEEIAYCIFEARLGAEGAFKRNGSSSYRIARAIEAAHGIGGEE